MGCLQLRDDLMKCGHHSRCDGLQWEMNLDVMVHLENPIKMDDLGINVPWMDGKESLHFNCLGTHP